MCNAGSAMLMDITGKSVPRKVDQEQGKVLDALYVEAFTMQETARKAQEVKERVTSKDRQEERASTARATSKEAKATSKEARKAVARATSRATPREAKLKANIRARFIRWILAQTSGGKMV